MTPSERRTPEDEGRATPSTTDGTRRVIAQSPDWIITLPEGRIRLATEADAHIGLARSEGHNDEMA